MRITKPLATDRLLTTDNRPTDRSSTNPPTTDPRTTSGSSTDPLTTDHWPTDHIRTDPPTTDPQYTNRFSTDHRLNKIHIQILHVYKYFLKSFNPYTSNCYILRSFLIICHIISLCATLYFFFGFIIKLII